MKPKTYWEKRAAMNEGYIDSFITIVGNALPHIHYELIALVESWNNEIDALEGEFIDNPEGER